MLGAWAAATVATVIGAAASLAEDIPPGSDLAVQIDVGQLRSASAEAWEGLRPVLPFHPGLERASKRLEGKLQDTLNDIERLTGANLQRPKVIATVAIDLDATGGTVYSAVIRGAFATAPQPDDSKNLESGVVRIAIDGHPAFRSGDTAWTVINEKRRGAALVYGNIRGIQRQVRQLLGDKKRAADDRLMVVARRLRARAPLLVAFSFDEETQTELADLFSDFGFLFETANAGIISAHEDGFEMQLDSAAADDRDAVAHGLRAAMALVRSAVALLEGSTELLLGLDAVGKRSTMLPRGLDSEELAPLLDKWVRNFELDTKVKKRSKRTTEIAVKLSSYRALAVIGLLLIGNSSLGSISIQSEASALLRVLRRAQLLHKEINGEFVKCGPVPDKIPTRRIRWPSVSCFDRLAFVPPKPVRVQLEATVDDGKLVLVARADPDGDGIPQVWYLDEESETVRGMAPQEAEAEGD